MLPEDAFIPQVPVCKCHLWWPEEFCGFPSTHRKQVSVAHVLTSSAISLTSDLDVELEDLPPSVM